MGGTIFNSLLPYQSKQPRSTTPALQPSAPVKAPPPSNNDTDSFGQGGVDPLAPLPVNAPAAPAPAPAESDYRQRAAKTANINDAPGGYNDTRGKDYNDALNFNNELAQTSAGRAGVEVPFLGSGTNNPIKNTVNTVFEAAQGAPLHGAEMAFDDPLMTLATGGLNVVTGGTDRAVDLVGSGMARDITGDPEAEVNAPLTPAQLYDPNGPLYKDSNTTIQQPGIKQIGEGVVDGFNGLVDAFDFSGNGGAGGGLGGGAAGGALGNALGSAGNARALGAGVMGGQIAPPNAADRTAQAGALGATQAFAGGPRAVDPVMGELDAFMKQGEGPSKAQLLLDQASQGAMADVLSASRSARSRSAGDQARQAAVAQGEIAGMGVDNARNAALLRQQEAQDFIGQQLAALGQKGSLATSKDAGTLGALGTSADLTSAMRNAGVQERGQTLGFGQGMESIAGNLEGDVVGAIPGLEAVRHDDQYELTPEQKLKVALLGGVGDVFSLFG